MNKKAAIGDIIMDNILFLIIVAIFLVFMLYIVLQYQSSAVVWEKFYTGEITKVIDFSIPGDSVCLNVHKATEIAKSNNVLSDSEIFTINNAQKEICTKLSKGQQTCLNYFNDVDTIDWKLKLSEGKDSSGASTINILCFNIVKTQKKVEEIV